MLLWHLLGILLWAGSENEEVRAVGPIGTGDWTIPPRGWDETSALLTFPNTCKNNGTTKTKDLYFCYNHTRIHSTIRLRKSDFTIGGWTADLWQGYVWYLNSPGGKQAGSVWKDVFVNTGKWGSGSYGTSALAKNWTSRIQLQDSTDMLTLVVNTTQTPLDKPQGHGQHSDPPCDVIMLCIYRSSGLHEDPCVYVGFCPNITNETMNASSTVKQEGSLTVGPKTTSRIQPVMVNGWPSKDDWFMIATGISGMTNNWLIMMEQAANASGESCMVCMGPRPLLRIVPAPINKDCLITVMSQTVPSVNCTSWDDIFPVTKAVKHKPIFSSNVAQGNFTCVNIKGTKAPVSDAFIINRCKDTLDLDKNFKPVPRADIWWYCGDIRLFDKIPKNSSGVCALVTLILPVVIIPMSVGDLIEATNTIVPKEWSRHTQRDTSWQQANNPTYIDAIGVPRGVPDEYKLVDQVSAGFESSICWWCTIHKNADRINYIHYNVQRLSNWTQSSWHSKTASQSTCC
uniref:Uncharacterized protein n=1 Tax=Cynoglossus semilaevis TaxID=244447 RepID=A0A3P8WMN6_CYNSE